MALPSVLVLRQLARARLREAIWGAAWAISLLLLGITTIGLAVAAGVVATAERIGVVPALLSWAGGLLLLALVAVLARFNARRRRRIRELERSTANTAQFSASLVDDIGFKAGAYARNNFSPLASVAIAFAIGALFARTRR